MRNHTTAAMSSPVTSSSKKDGPHQVTTTQLEVLSEATSMEEYSIRRVVTPSSGKHHYSTGFQNSDDEGSSITTCSSSVKRAVEPQAGQSDAGESIPRPAKRKRSENALTVEQIREHLSALQQLAGQQTDNMIENDESICRLCGLSEPMLAPEPRYCSCCGVVIEREITYYRTTFEDSEQHNVCSLCYKDPQRSINGQRILENTLSLVQNAEEIEELWVQCDECDEWNHQICGLYNNSDEKYRCLKCQLKDMDGGDNTPSSNGAFSGAKDLPQTNLSIFLEQRLLRRLKEDREERANDAGKSFDEVPGAEGLSVRVVLSVKKKLSVNNNLLSVLGDENYPTEFPYTTKMILLFQEIEGVDVCLFSMYVQEYGSDCCKPNHRYVHISYVDSVNYFRPSTGTSTGESLRTFAYHQVLIGYLDYVKRRGFARCYLWACPPINGENYILNCRPETQKIPKPSRLRKWYQTMVKKAAEEGIVVHCSTLYDVFFVQTEQPDCKITAARLPYFDGDYWPRVVDELLKDIEEETKKNTANGMKKATTKTSLKVSGDAVTKDVLLMQKLGKDIKRFRKNFMVIDLQFFCTLCHEPILSGKRWMYRKPKNSILCQRCHDVETAQTSSKKNRKLSSEVVVDVSVDTKDEDGTLVNCMCENRNKFLEFCQDNQYQFDTLHRAKHSSLMILQHISPTAISKVALPENERLELMDILQHVSQCPSNEATSCSYRGCDEIRAMFLHSTKCNVQADGGCIICQKVWYTLSSHADHCKEPNCQMPFCKNLKNQASSHTESCRPGNDKRRAK